VAISALRKPDEPASVEVGEKTKEGPKKGGLQFRICFSPLETQRIERRDLGADKRNTRAKGYVTEEFCKVFLG